MSGNKDEMIAKIADGIVLGRIPRCPHCFGGRYLFSLWRPKFDFKKGTYNCPGYRDDVDFKNCHKTFTLAEITRDPWEWYLFPWSNPTSKLLHWLTASPAQKYQNPKGICVTASFLLPSALSIFSPFAWPSWICAITSSARRLASNSFLISPCKSSMILCSLRSMLAFRK